MRLGSPRAPHVSSLKPGQTFAGINSFQVKLGHKLIFQVNALLTGVCWGKVGPSVIGYNYVLFLVNACFVFVTKSQPCCSYDRGAIWTRGFFLLRWKRFTLNWYPKLKNIINDCPQVRERWHLLGLVFTFRKSMGALAFPKSQLNNDGLSCEQVFQSFGIKCAQKILCCSCSVKNESKLLIPEKTNCHLPDASSSCLSIASICRLKI